MDITNSFQKLPIKDIEYMLKYHHKNINEPYTDGLNFILYSNPGILVPVSIADYVLSVNANDKNIKDTNTSTINSMNNNELLNLSKILGLEIPNKERILRILYLMGKLDDMEYFDGLPDDVLIHIINNLDVKSIETLCNLNQRFNKYCFNPKVKDILKEKFKYDLHGLIPNGNLYKYLLRGGKVKRTSDGGFDFIKSNMEIEKIKNVVQYYRVPESRAQFYLTTEGKVHIFTGDRNRGFGTGDIKLNNYDLIVHPYLKDIVHISVAKYNHVACDIHGDVYFSGDFGYWYIRKLWDGTTEKLYPTKVPGFNNIVRVLSLVHTIVGLDNKGDLYICYSDEDHVYHPPELIFKNVKDIGGLFETLLFLDNDGFLHEKDIASDHHKKITDIENVVYFTISSNRVFAMANEGEVFTFLTKGDEEIKLLENVKNVDEIYVDNNREYNILKGDTVTSIKI
jgi:hypothetical protein